MELQSNQCCPQRCNLHDWSPTRSPVMVPLVCSQQGCGLQSGKRDGCPADRTCWSSHCSLGCLDKLEICSWLSEAMLWHFGLGQVCVTNNLPGLLQTIVTLCVTSVVSQTFTHCHLDAQGRTGFSLIWVKAVFLCLNFQAYTHMQKYNILFSDRKFLLLMRDEVLGMVLFAPNVHIFPSSHFVFTHFQTD